MHVWNHHGHVTDTGGGGGNERLSGFCERIITKRAGRFSLQRLMENSNTSVCLNELIAIEHGELRSQIKLQAANALLTAAENVSDAVEITSEAHEVQVRRTHFSSARCATYRSFSRAPRLVSAQVVCLVFHEPHHPELKISLSHADEETGNCSNLGVLKILRDFLTENKI